MAIKKTTKYGLAVKRAAAALRKKNKGKSGTLAQVHALAKKSYFKSKTATKSRKGKGKSKAAGRKKAGRRKGARKGAREGAKKKAGRALTWPKAVSRASKELHAAGKKPSQKMVMRLAKQIYNG